MELYRAHCEKNVHKIQEVMRRMRAIVRIATRSSFMLEVDDRPNYDLFLMLRHMPETLERFTEQLEFPEQLRAEKAPEPALKKRGPKEE